MSEFWLTVTVCAASTISGTPYNSGQPALSYDCAEYRVAASFPTVQDCRLYQFRLNDLPLEGREITASLCTATVDRGRLKQLPLLGGALGDHA